MKAHGLKEFLLLALLVVSPAPALPASEFDASVTRVIDGDSVRIRIKLSTGTYDDECRMLRYNAPEMTGPERPMGKKALRKLAGLVEGKEVRVRTDSRDRHGRMLCDMWLEDGTYVNAAMREFLKDYPRRDIYLWKEKSPMPGDRRQ